MITVYDASADGNTVATIPIGKLYPQYYCVQLYPTPDAAITYYVDGAQRLVVMDDTLDTPVLPEEFHDLVLYGALVLEYEKQDDPRVALADRLYREGLTALKYAIASEGTFGSGAQARYSRLGAWTPAG